MKQFIFRQTISTVLLTVLLFQAYSCSKKGTSGGPQPPVNLSSLSIVDVTQQRDNKNPSAFRFYINVVPVSTKEIKVNYTTKDSTALSSTDYTAASGTLTIPAGQSVAYVDVTVRGDSLRQTDQFFTVVLTNPLNAKLEGAGRALGTIQSNGTWLPTDNSGYSTPLSYPGYTLVWNNEFSGDALNLSEWNQEIGNGAGGWGNNELEYYTNSTKNTFLSNGNLIIEARKEVTGNFNYTSGRMTTQGKKEFKFGRIDIRAKLPVGKGIWPALWMLGANINTAGWPVCGEIDIMELVGTNPARVHGTMHWKPVSGASINKGGSYDLSSGNFSDRFRVFSIIWEEDKVRWFVDDVLYFTFTKADVGAANYPFNAPQFLIFNVAVGGNWPGPPDASTVFPQRMYVDYVRVFQ
ncbi:MAG: family 16 glycosylhydrolase [Chitinophagaceae bacterium]|nr:family 16 glycosylhydrolase [Chitinophagaceae bacterium]